MTDLSTGNIFTTTLGLVRRFFSDKNVVVLFIMLMLSLSANCGGYVYGKYKDAMIERAKRKLEEADRRFLVLRTKAEDAIKAYEDFQKKVDKELADNQKLKQEINAKKEILKKSIDDERKKIDRMGIKELVDEFNKAGYGTTEKKNEK